MNVGAFSKTQSNGGAVVSKAGFPRNGPWDGILHADVVLGSDLRR